MTKKRNVRVIVNGYGVIGKRVADAVRLQPDMDLIGIADIATDYRIKIAQEKGLNIFASQKESVSDMERAGIRVAGTLEDALKKADVVVDATPKGIGAKNKILYDARKIKAVFQGGESHELTGYSFVAQVNYEGAVGKTSTRCVSCNTTGLLRVLSSFAERGLVKKVRASLFRRATDPWESHRNGLVNTAVPERDIPSHQAPDVQTVIPDMEIVTIAARAPYTLSHLHTAFIEFNDVVSRDDALRILHETPRVVFVRSDEGVEGLHSTIEIVRDLGRPRADLWEVAVWEDSLAVEGNELMLVYQVHNEAIVIPENIDAIRALSGIEPSGAASIRKTDSALGVRSNLYGHSLPL
ncbi:type II glyceraldehyde-3-phosphate dehydrogenase [Candidatus Uhrbacteria bacterium]|nr:type II glyceraldehyde-3-phosphate dehydrogenase [Candidatus Uhrbacteria bacterium]